ncbi:MAG: putative Ig domain-containing protein, partial [Aureliella sp.]
ASATHRYSDGPAERNIFATARDAAGNVYLANGWQVAVADVAPELSISGAAEVEAGALYKLDLSAIDPGDDSLSGWTISWGDGAVDSLPGDATSAQHVYHPRYAKPTRYKIQATARDDDNASGSPYRSNTLSISVVPDTSLKLPTIDFERSAVGARLRPGNRISDQFAALGLSVSTLSETQSPMILAAGQVTDDEHDRGKNDCWPIGNVLAIADENGGSSLDSDAISGTLVFNFEKPVRLDEVQLFGIADEGSSIRLFADDGTAISSVSIPNCGSKSLQVVALNASHVGRMEIVLASGGAVASIVSCRDNRPIPIPESRYFVIDAGNRIFRYSAQGFDIGDFEVAPGMHARGIAADRDANLLWIISEEGNQDRVYVYDTARERLLGSWKPQGVIAPQGIATDGNDIWILDGSSNRVLRYASAAHRRSGAMAAKSSFALRGDNRQPNDLVTDGSSLWVVDGGSDKVYAYQRDGSLLNQWALDPANSDPVGIAINPSSDDGIYVVDATSQRVYSYPRRTLPVNGSQLAVDSFALATGNSSPIGLADPGDPIRFGDLYSGTLTAGQVVDWTISATAGQNIYVHFETLSAWMQSDLIAPDGHVIYSKISNRPWGLDSGSLSLPATGNYTLRLTANATSAPNYAFRVFDIPPPDVHEITFGQVEEGALESPGRADQWTFTAASGTRLYLDFLTLQTVVGGDLVVDVVAPSGAIISTRTATRVNSLDQGFTLLESGVHTLKMHAAFDGAQTPSYSFQLWQVPADDVGQLTYRQSASGTIEVPGARDRWTFDAAAGQNVFVDFVRITGGDLRVQVVLPDGNTLASRTFSLPAGLDQELVLPQSGTYTVIVDGAGTANLNTYEFTLWDIPPELIEPTTLNTTLSGYAVPGQTVPFEFQAQAGTPILLDLIETSNQALGVTIIQPDGQTLITRATKDTLATLPQTGTYRALVARASPSLLDGHGDYAFRIQDASSPERGEPDNRGTRFYVAFPPNLREVFVTYDPTFSLSVTSAVDTSGTVQIPGLGFYTTYEVKAGEATVIALPATVELSDPDKVLDRGILVTALDEVSVYGLDQFQFLTEGFTALPTDAIGKDYYVLGYANTVNYAIGGGTNFTLAATTNNTQVTIVPSVAVGTHAAGVPFTITLNQGQAYTLHTSVPLFADLSGTRVTATEPIALFGGNTATRVPSGFSAANHLIEQLPPLEAWGRRFITLPLATRTGGDTFRILAQQDGTEVRIDGQLVATLAAGQFDERILTAGSIIEGSVPLLVAQYSNSSAFDNAQADPFMMLVPPFEQYLNDYVLTTPATGFDTNFANLVAPTSAIESVTLDDQAVPAAAFAPIGASGYLGARIAISVGAHHFHADEPLGVSIYGYAPFDAYGYFGGMSAGSVAAVSSLTLTPGDVALPTGTQHTVTAAVFDRFGAPLPGVRVDFTVVGASTERYFAVTDRDGRASIVYTRTAPGSDTITASVAGQVQTATAAWLAASPIIHLIQPATGDQVPAGKLLITGIASPGSPGAAIVEVTVNGRRADVLDAAGNFFAVVDVMTDSQTFVFTATDSFRLEASTTLTLVGVSDTDTSFDLQQSSDVTASTSVQFSGTTFNRKTHRVLADMRVRNAGAEPLDPAIAVQLDRIAPSSVHLVAADSVSDDGHSLMVFDSELPPDGLASGQVSAPIAIALDDAALDRFALELSVLARNNRPPRFVSSPQLEIAAGSTYRYAASAIDLDSSRITYALTSAPTEMQIDADTGVITWPVSADWVGSHQISITASDGRGGVATQTFTLSVLSSLPNRPPVFQSAPNTGVLPGADYRYAAEASDADNDAIVFSLAEGPSGMTVDAASGLVSYDNAVSGVYSVALTASDTRGGTATQRFTLQVGSSSGIGSPTILSTPPVTTVAGSQYVYTVWAVDPMQSQLEFSLLEAPAGMAIDSASGRMTWQPTSSDVGTEPSVRIEVRNALGGIGSQAYRLAVLAVRPGAAPVFQSKPLVITTVDQVYRYAAQASDPDGQPLVYGLATAPAGMAINSTTGEITWTASAGDRGEHRILITATDPAGLVGYQAYALSVRGLNTPPEFVSSPELSTTLGNAYRYNARASDAEDEVTYALVDAPASMLIDVRGGAVTWRPSLSDVGTHLVTIRATDARGLAADQTFELIVAADSEAPTIEIAMSEASVDVGQSVTVRVSASDNVAVTSLLLYANGQPLALDPSGEATFTATASGFQQFVATAVDASSNAASARALLRVRDASDTTPPTVSIQSPSSNAVLTYLTDIVGSVTDANLEKVVLEYSRLGMNNWHTIAARSILDGGPIAVDADRIGTFDPTLLLNDQYEIRLTGTDLNGLSASTSIVVNLEGNAKIGTLEIPSAEECQTCSAGDVTIPVAGGPPIAITRQYSTLTADQSGDFGQGWQFCMAEPNLRETPARSEFEDIMGQFAALPFREGQKVYITTPTCERVGFTFSPTLHTGVWSEVGSAFYDPRWVPDPGVDWQLYGENDYTRLTGIASGEFDLNGLPLPLVQYEGDQYILAGLSASYNPLGYQLISKDGTRYHYSQSEGLLDVTDRHGNKLSMTADGITSSSGQAVQFQRDTEGRITKIVDGEGRETTYTYNADGELVKVEYPSGLSNTYRYTADHLLAGINEGANPSEQEMLTRSFQYDAAGRLAATLDAFGYSNTQTYDLATRTQTNFDALGNATMYQYDARGNIVWERSPTGATITMEYDADDNRTRIVDEMGFATSFTYDAHGNTTSVTDALGNTTSFAYDKANNVVYQRDARGGEYFYYYSDDGDGRGKDITRAVQPGGGDSQLTYDTAGRLLSVTDVDGRVRRYEYGNQPYPVRITERDGSSVQIEYNAHGHIQAYIDELGRRTTYTY